MTSNPLCPKTERERDEAQAEVERLRREIEEALRCLTLIGHAGKKWSDKSRAARVVLTKALNRALHPAEGLYACPTCGENVTRYGQRCERCTRSIEEDRLEQESGR